MEQQSDRIPGPHFKTHKSGDSFTFSHSVSGTVYTLTVQELERQTIPQKAFGSDRLFYPTHTVAMGYTLSPEPAEDITVCDCVESDRPLEIMPSENPISPDASNSVGCIGIIGGADGVTAVVFGENPQSKLRAAYSSLHFEPIEDDIEWRVEFSVKRFGEASFLLI